MEKLAAMKGRVTNADSNDNLHRLAGGAGASPLPSPPDSTAYQLCGSDFGGCAMRTALYCFTTCLAIYQRASDSHRYSDSR